MTISEEGGNSNKHGLFQQLFRRSKTSNSDQHDAVTITTNNTTSSSLGNTITNRRTKRNTTQQQKQQQQTATTQIMRQRPRNQNEFDRNPTTASAPNQRLPNMMSYSASNSYDNYHRHSNHHLQTSPNKGGIPTRPKLRQHQPSFDNDMSSHPNTTSTAATVQYGIQHRQQEMNSTTSSHPTPGNDMFWNNHSSSKWQQGESFQHHYPAMNNDPNNQYQHQRPSIPPQQGHNHSSSFLVLNNDHSSPTTSWQQAATASQGYYIPQQQHQPPPPPLGYYDSFYHQVNSLNNGQGYQNHPQQQTQQPYRANRPQSQLWSTQGMQTQHSTTTTQRVIKQGQTAEQQQQRSQSQPRQTQPFHRNSAVGALSVSSSPLGGTTQMLLGLQKQSRGNGNGDSSISSAPIISGGGYETTGQRPRTSRNDHTREQYLMYSKSNNNNNNNNNPHPYYQQSQNWMPNSQQSLQMCSLANTTKNKSDNNSSSNMQPPHLSQYLSNQDTGNSMDSLNTTLATTEISNQDTGNSMDSVNTTFATTENFPRGSYHHPQNKIESRSNSNHQHQRAFSMDETSGRNSVVVKPKGILKKSEAAPIQPIVYQSMMKDQRQRQQQLARRNPDLTLNTMASTALISNHQSNHLGTAVSEITQFTTGLQDEHDHGSNKTNNPIDQLQGHNHNVSQRRHQQPQFDDIQQPPYPRQATKGSERSTNVAQHMNETHPVNYSMYDSSQQSAAPKDSNFQYTQGSQQLFAIPQLSHTHSLDNFSGPHTRTRQQRASSVGSADQYNERRSARPTASASQASYLRTKNPNISMDFSRENRSIDIPNSNAMRLLQDDSETKSVLSSPSAFTRSAHATNTSKSHAVNQSPHSFASGSRNVYFTENGESKSFVSFTTSEASHPSRSGHTIQGGNNGSMLALALSTQVMQSFNFGKEQRTQGYAKTISMMSSEMAITRGSDVSHISSRAGKYRSASAPRVHQNTDQDAKTAVSSGSILTKGSHLSSGSRHSSSLNISRHDDDDTRSVITNSSSRPPQNSYDDYDGKSVATDTRSIRSSQTRGSVRSSSSNRSEHRPAPNAWDVDKGARARRANASGDGTTFQIPKTPAQKKKESIAIATELSDKVVSSLLSQQGLADSSFSYDTVVRKTPSQMEMNSNSDLIVSSSAAGQVSADLKGHVLRVQMETLRHQLNDIISERNPDSSHVSIPPIPPFSDSHDKCIHANPLNDSSLETTTSAKPTTEISGAQDEVNTVKPTGHESPIKWTPVESISDCLSDSLSWSPPLSNPRAKKVTAIENGQHAEPSVKNVSSDTMEAKAVKKAKKKKTSKEGKSSKEKLPKKMKPDAVAKIANELKPAICCVTNEVGIHHHAGFSDTDDQSPEWTMTRRSGPAILPVNDRQEEMLPQKDKPVLMTDLRPGALEGGLSSHGTGKSMEFSEHFENQQLSKPAKSAKKKSKKKESKITSL